MNGDAGLGFTRHTRTVGVRQGKTSNLPAPQGRSTPDAPAAWGRVQARICRVCVAAICNASALGPRLGSRPPREISRSCVNVDPRYQRCRPEMADASFVAILDQKLTVQRLLVVSSASCAGRVSSSLPSWGWVPSDRRARRCLPVLPMGGHPASGQALKFTKSFISLATRLSCSPGSNAKSTDAFHQWLPHPASA